MTQTREKESKSMTDMAEELIVAADKLIEMADKLIETSNILLTIRGEGEAKSRKKSVLEQILDKLMGHYNYTYTTDNTDASYTAPSFMYTTSQWGGTSTNLNGANTTTILGK